jgi:GTP-binding protein EngB required for normal cell division
MNTVTGYDTDEDRLLNGMKRMEIASNPNQERNILILGETGVGKSTWINGFANFQKYTSLEEAEREPELTSLIPTEFTVCKQNFEEILVRTGSDGNETFASGHSATQACKIYTFTDEETGSRIRLIDTPGIGDTRGVEQDKKNFQNILSTIANLDEIHGICILLKPNEARLGVVFRFCIQELLTYLHKDAARNIIFCFTNSRGTFYRPGDTMRSLKKLLQKNNDVMIPLNVDTIYCYDSEAYRFLAAIKNEPPVTFDEGEFQSFVSSWDKSVAETWRMLQYIGSLKPHPVRSTMNLNQAKELVIKLARPLAEISRLIQVSNQVKNPKLPHLTVFTITLLASLYN